MKMDDAILVGGLFHFVILIASASVPKVLNWKENLSVLHPFLRKLFWVYGVFIFITILAFGVLSVVNSRELVSGNLLARSFCGFVSIFWLLRIVVQIFVFDTDLLKNRILVLGYHGLTFVFIFLAVVYGLACLGFGK